MRNLSDIRCPQCKKNNVSTLTEILDGGSMEFLVEDGKVSNTGLLEHGSPRKVLATCICGHEWVLRGVINVDEIEAERFEHWLNQKLED